MVFSSAFFWTDILIDMIILEQCDVISTKSASDDINTLRPWQNGRHFADDIFKWIFLTENVWISINISLKFVPMVQINNIPVVLQIMAWRRLGDKSLSEPMMLSWLTHICVTPPQWVNTWGRDKMGNTLQMTFSNGISWIKIVIFWLKFSWNLSHGSNKQYSSIGVDNDMELIRHYLSQWWLSSLLMLICSSWSQQVNYFSTYHGYITVSAGDCFHHFPRGILNNLTNIISWGVYLFHIVLLSVRRSVHPFVRL